MTSVVNSLKLPFVRHVIKSLEGGTSVPHFDYGVVGQTNTIKQAISTYTRERFVFEWIRCVGVNLRRHHEFC